MTAAIAAMFWAVSHAIGAIYLLWVWRQERRAFLLLFAASWAVMALWGVTLTGTHPVLVVLNTIVVPPLASALGMAAIFTMTTSTIRHRRANAAQAALLRRAIAERKR